MRAIIAGRGALPAAIVNAGGDIATIVCALEGFLPDNIDVDHVFRLEHLGSLLGLLRQRGVTDVCFAGSIRRPPIDPSAIDAATLPLVPLLQGAMGQGDDAALRAVVGLFEHQGFTVVGAQDLAPDLLAPEGILTKRQPDSQAESDAIRAAQIIGAMATVDVGQACVVHKGQALAIEGVFGTDWMLQSLQARPDEAGGLLLKALKPGQDQRVDLPTIGPDTITAVKQAGLDGIVVEAGHVLILSRAETVARAQDAGLFLWCRAGAAG